MTSGRGSSVGGLLEGALSWRGACRCGLSWVMVTSNSYDLGVTANTLQYITPWPGDQDTAHYTTLEEPQVPQHRFPKQRSSQSGSLAGISSNLQAARSIGPASPQSINISRSTAAASRGVACRSESFSGLRCIVWRRAKPCQLHRQDLLGDHRSSSPGSAVHWPGLFPIHQSNLLVRQQQHRVASPTVQSVLRVLRYIVWRRAKACHLHRQ